MTLTLKIFQLRFVSLTVFFIFRNFVFSIIIIARAILKIRTRVGRRNRKYFHNRKSLIKARSPSQPPSIANLSLGFSVLGPSICQNLSNSSRVWFGIRSKASSPYWRLRNSQPTYEYIEAEMTDWIIISAKQETRSRVKSECESPNLSTLDLYSLTVLIILSRTSSKLDDFRCERLIFCKYDRTSMRRPISKSCSWKSIVFFSLELFLNKDVCGINFGHLTLSRALLILLVPERAEAPPRVSK